jgi:gamma-glutamyltranspeptidase/glutathione hydrolase
MWAAAFERECADGYGYVLSGHVNELGHRAVTTPGILRVFEAAHAAWGRRRWAELLDPAIAFAEEGWIVRPHVYAMWTTNEAAHGRVGYIEKLGFTAEGRALYVRDDGTPKRPGERVRNPRLAATLRRVAAEGAASFYEGSIADEILADMRAHDGLLAAADLRGFVARRAAPLRVAYRGRTISLPAPPAGGIVIAEMLRILERFDLIALGHNSPAYIRVVAEAMKIAGRDREAHIGDPAFNPPPLDRLLSDAYADACAERIRRGERTALARVDGEPRDTTTISCVDADGLVASLTHTLGTPSGVIPPGTGFMLNGAMNWYDPRPGRAGSIAPGKKRFSSMAPTMVFEGDTPVMTLGAPGGGLDRRRHPAGAAQRARLGHGDSGGGDGAAVQRHDRRDRHLQPDSAQRRESARGARLWRAPKFPQLPLCGGARDHHVRPAHRRRCRPAARRLCAGDRLSVCLKAR